MSSGRAQRDAEIGDHRWSVVCWPTNDYVDRVKEEKAMNNRTIGAKGGQGGGGKAGGGKGGSGKGGGGANPNYPSRTGNPSGPGRGNNAPKK